MDQLVLVMESGIMYAEFLELVEVVRLHGSDELKEQINAWIQEQEDHPDYLHDDTLPTKLVI